MRRLKLRAPAFSAPLGELVAWAWPLADGRLVEHTLAQGRVTIEGVPEGDGSVVPEAGAVVEILAADEVHSAPTTKAQVVAKGEGWVVVIKPADHPDAPLGVSGATLSAWAKAVGVPRLVPVLPMDGEVTGLWLLADGDDRAAEMRKLMQGGAGVWALRALVPRIGQRHGRLRDKDDAGFLAHWSVEQTRLDVDELRISLERGRTLPLRRALADGDAAVLGDARQGGIGVPGGLALWSSEISLPELGVLVQQAPPEQGWWPQAAVRPPFEPNPVPRIVVSAPTLKALKKGHQWVLTDTETQDVGGYAPGTLVRLMGSDERRGPKAVVEGTGLIAARYWGRGGYEEVATRVNAALSRRKSLFALAKGPKGSDAFRLIHGEADGLPGLTVDRLGRVLRATVVARTAEGFKESVYAQLKKRFPDWSLVEISHLRDLRAGGAPEARVLVDGLGMPETDGQRIEVSEGALRFLADPLGAPSTGFFADQRDNRRRVARVARRGQRWLNLFCHTGAFSAVLLKAGAQVVSVDLSAAYLAWLDDNLALNGLGAGHTTVRKDARRFLASGEAGTFDGIIIDPPTFSGAGQGHWSARSDYRALLQVAIPLLNKGGHLLACRNDRRRKPTLEALVRGAAEQEKVAWASLEEAPPSEDYPAMEGFTEGDAFEGVWAVQGGGLWHPLMDAAPARRKRRA